MLSKLTTFSALICALAESRRDRSMDDLRVDRMLNGADAALILADFEEDCNYLCVDKCATTDDNYCRRRLSPGDVPGLSMITYDSHTAYDRRPERCGEDASLAPDVYHTKIAAYEGAGQDLFIMQAR